MGPSALAGRRLAAATAGWRKASELFKHSCAIYSHNEPRTHVTRHTAASPEPSTYFDFVSTHGPGKQGMHVVVGDGEELE